MIASNERSGGTSEGLQVLALIVLVVTNLVALVAFGVAIIHIIDCQERMELRLGSQIRELKDDVELNGVWVRTHKHGPNEATIGEDTE